MPIVIEFIKTYWKPFAIAGIAAFLFLFGYYKGYEHEKSALVAIEERYKAAQAVAEAHNAEVVKQQQIVTDKVTKEYTNAIDKLNQFYHDHPIKWVQPNNSASCKVSSVSNTTSQSNGTTKSDQSSAEGVTPVDCADTTMQLLLLQKWVREQESIQ